MIRVSLGRSATPTELKHAENKYYIDCGWRDQYRMHYGNPAVVGARCVRTAYEHRYEEFDGTHSGIDFRLDRSLSVLSRAIR